MADHPASQGLRELADWLDESGAYVCVSSVGFSLAVECPEDFARFVRESQSRINDSSIYTVFAHGKLCGLTVCVSAEKKKVGTLRTVTREEFVIGGAP